MSISSTPRAAVLGLTVGALVTGGLALAPVATAASTDSFEPTLHSTYVTPSGTVGRMSSPKTVSPRSRKSSAVAWPMPEAAPVMTTVRGSVTRAD